MLSTVLKRSVPLCPRVAPTVFQRGHSIEMKGYGDKERGEEVVYFKKEDEKLLRTLLAKMNKQTAQHDVEGTKAAREVAMGELDSLVGSKLSKEEKEQLIKWKVSH